MRVCVSQCVSVSRSLTCCLRYGCNGRTFSDEMFPVFAKTSILKGGLDFEATDIGSALSIGGIVLIIYQTFVYPLVVRKVGLIRSFNGGCVMTLALVLVFPFIHLLRKHNAPPVIMWGALLLLFTWRMVASANCFVVRSPRSHCRDPV